MSEAIKHKEKKSNVFILHWYYNSYMIVNYNLWQVGWQLCLITGLAVLKLYISALTPSPHPSKPYELL